MKTYYIFRHGETYYSRHNVPYGDNEHSAHILPQATASIKKIAKFLQESSVSLAVRSEFLRCEETCKIIQDEVGIKFETHPTLNEFTEKDFSLFHKRMEILTSHLNGSPAQAIAICTHGAVIAALQKMLVGKTFEVHDLMYYPKTGVVLKVEGETLSEVDFNV